jgi:hypothetical protein
MSPHDLQTAVKLRQAIIDADVRSADYVNRAKILSGSAAAGAATSNPDDAVSHIDVDALGSLVPAIRMQVDQALEPGALLRSLFLINERFSRKR